MSINQNCTCQFNEEEKPFALCETRHEKFEIESINGVQDKRDRCLLSPQRTIRELIGCIESVLHRDNGEDNNEEMSTPSTKRKDNSVGALSISSSTRNLRSKVVKVEKMPEL
ncbi:hypothetical protein Bca101_043649 [Brassica carinata]